MARAANMKKALRTQKRLINTALRLIWLHGYTEVSIDAIAKAAKVKKGSVYHFFPSKMDLLIAAMDYVAKIYAKKLHHINEQARSPRQALLNYIHWLCEAQKQAKARYGFVPGFFYMSIGAALAKDNEVLAADLHSSYQKHFSYVSQILIDMSKEESLIIDPLAMTNTIVFIVSGAVWQARISNDTKPLDDVSLALAQLLDTP